MYIPRRFPLRHAAGALTLAVALGACGGQEKAPGGQAIARVNHTELTVHQLNAELAQRLGAQPGSDSAERMRAKAADALVDRTLLVQAAVEEELDNDPAVAQAVARGREEVLAAAYLQRTLDLVSQPTEAQVRQYYDAHPELYAQRKVYQLTQVIAPGEVDLAEVESAAEAAEVPQQMAQWFTGKNIDAQTRTTLLPTEHVPPAMREKLDTIAPGQAVLVRTDGQVVLNYLIEAREAPVGFDRARPAIEKGLADTARRTRIREEIDRLRARSQVVWLGEMAQRDSGGATDGTAPPAAGPATDTRAAQEASDGQDANDESAADKELEAGLRGLN